MANRKSPAINLINWLPFWFNTGVSYLEPLYGMVGDPIKGATWSRTFFFFGKMVRHLGFSLYFPEAALVAKNRIIPYIP
jgi:hypothetical protein